MGKELKQDHLIRSQRMLPTFDTTCSCQRKHSVATVRNLSKRKLEYFQSSALFKHNNYLDFAGNLLCIKCLMFYDDFPF